MPHRTVTVVLVAAATLLVGGLTGCGTATDGQPGTSPSAGSSSSSSASTGVGTATRSATPVSPTGVTPTAPASTARGPQTTLLGTLSRGAIEGSCLVLTTSSEGADAGRRYLLVGDSTTLHALTDGATVAVSGHPETGLATACQAGTPFFVEQVLPSK